MHIKIIVLDEKTRECARPPREQSFSQAKQADVQLEWGVCKTSVGRDAVQDISWKLCYA